MAFLEPVNNCAYSGDIKEFASRAYQDEMAERALRENIICVLGTGTGKTYIAVKVVRELSDQINGRWGDTGVKRTVFLVPSVPLVAQQAKVLREMTGIATGEYCSGKVESFTVSNWNAEFQQNKILVMIHDIFKDVLQSAILSSHQINLVVFDECHHARKEHPYREVMRLLHSSAVTEVNRPRILGLTASVINAKLAKDTKDPEARTRKAFDELEKEFKALEMCMGATVVTSYDYSLRDHGARPDPIVKNFKLAQLPEEAKDILDSIAEFFDWLDCARRQCEPSAALSSDIKARREAVVDSLRDVKNAFGQIKNAMITLGAWAAYKTSEDLMSSLKSMKERLFVAECTTHLDSAICCLQLFGTRIENVYRIKTVSAREILSNPALMSTKVQTLLDLLRTSAQQSSVVGTLNTERVNCWALYLLLKKLSEDPGYSFIRSDFCLGQPEDGSENPLVDKASNSAKKFRATIKKFREGDVNVLIATSVLEEGFDVPECGLIVSYVQSKGRARAKNSKYIMMVDDDKRSSFEQDLVQFKLIEEKLPAFCANRGQPTPHERAEHFGEDLICAPLCAPESDAKLFAGGALPTLIRYCNTLPNDNMNSFQIFPEHIKQGKMHQFRIYLPLSAAIKHPVLGPLLENEMDAKKAAALDVCRLLLERGELDPVNLLPKTRDSWDVDLMRYLKGHVREITAAGQPAAGSTRRVQHHPKQIAKALRYTPTDAAAPLFLYLIHYTPVATSLLIEDLGGPLSVGLLSSRTLPCLPHFLLYFNLTHLTVSLRPLPSIKLTASETTLVQRAHFKIFSSILELNRCGDMKFQPSDSSTENFLIVPLKTDTLTIDWMTINKVINPDAFIQQTVESLKAKKPNAEELKNAVVACWYRGEEERFIVKDVRPDLDPYSKVSENNLSPAEIVKDKYGFDVKYLDQPLIVLQHCSKALNFLVPKPPETKLEQRSNFLHFIPELFKILPLNAQFLMQCQLLPSVIYRVRQLYSCIELYQNLIASCGIGSSLAVPQSWKSLVCDVRFLKPKARLVVRDLQPKKSPSPDSAASSSSSPDLSSSSSLEPDHDTDTPQLFVKEYLQRAYYKKINQDRALRQKMANAQRNFSIPGSVPIKKVCSEKRKSGCGDTLDLPPFHLDDEFKRIIPNLAFPEPVQLLQALTTTDCNDFINLERLETMGDSFLKLMTCVYLYLEYPSYHEGKLDHLKAHQVSNYNLYRLGKERDIPRYVSNQFFDPVYTFLPPGFILTPDLQELYSKRSMQSLADKSLADVMEALIGVVLVECGCGAAQTFMHWLGLNVVPRKVVIGCNIPKAVPSALLRATNDPALLRSWPTLLANLDDFQTTIKYTFRRPEFLIQAFTHSSYLENRITDCYQRLEFLGDAILDFLVTKYLYSNEQSYGPGKLTDLRSALVNNKTFSLLAVKNNFHNYIKYSSPKIFALIKKFVDEKRTTHGKIMPLSDDMLDLNDGEDDDDDENDETSLGGSEMAEDPKVLGDVFESLAGAIFLDSGLSLDAVWTVYYCLMKNTLEYCVEHCPKNPVRLLFEAEPGNCHFGKSEPFGPRKIRVEVKIVGKGKFYGIGSNKRTAKCHAAREALIQLQHAAPQNMF